MTVQLWCLAAGMFLPYLWAGVSVPFRSQQFGQPDLNYPRRQGDALTDRGAGAWGAQGNAWENLTIFSVANLMAFMAGVDPAGNWATAAMVWVAARLLHGLFYVLNVAVARVACFLAGLAMSIWIVVMAFGAS